MQNIEKLLTIPFCWDIWGGLSGKLSDSSEVSSNVDICILKADASAITKTLCLPFALFISQAGVCPHRFISAPTGNV
jgi:hypothetical protein